MDAKLTKEINAALARLDEAMQQVRLKTTASTLKELRASLVASKKLETMAQTAAIELDLYHKLNGWNIDAKLLLQMKDPEDF